MGPGDIEELLLELLQLDDDADLVRLARRDERGAVAGRLLDRGGRRHQDVLPLVEQLDRGDDGAVLLQDEGGGDLAHPALRHEERVEAVGIEVVDLTGAVDVGRHGDGVAAQRPGVLQHIGAADIGGVLDDGAGARLEPAVEALIECDRGQHRDQHGRHGGDQAEHRDDAPVQPRAGAARLPGETEADQFPGDQQAKHHQEDGVGDQRAACHGGGGHQRRQAGEDGEGGDDGEQDDDDEAEADRANTPVAVAEWRHGIARDADRCRLGHPVWSQV